MALLSLYFDVRKKQLVVSESVPQPFALPNFHEEEKIGIQFKALRLRNPLVRPYYEVLSLTGWSLVISIGTAGTVNATQNTWDLNSEANQLSGVLNLATAGISALADGTAQTLEIRLYNATEEHKGQFSTKIKKGVSTTAALIVPPGDTAMAESTARGIFVLKEMPAGEGILFQSQDTTKKTLMYLDNDGEMQFAPVS